jgi:hypothetical protein
MFRKSSLNIFQAWRKEGEKLSEIITFILLAKFVLFNTIIPLIYSQNLKYAFWIQYSL